MVPSSNSEKDWLASLAGSHGAITRPASSTGACPGRPAAMHMPPGGSGYFLVEELRNTRSPENVHRWLLWKSCEASRHSHGYTLVLVLVPPPSRQV
jgi:hypothetical protein